MRASSRLLPRRPAAAHDAGQALAWCVPGHSDIQALHDLAALLGLLQLALADLEDGLDPDALIRAQEIARRAHALIAEVRAEVAALRHGQ